MKKMRQIVLWIFLGIAVVLTVFPVWYMLSHSLKSEEIIMNVYRNDLAAWDKVFIKPFCIHLGQYYRIFFRTPDFLYLFWNAVLITSCIVVFQVLLGIMAAYGLSKVKFPGSEILFFVYIIVMLMPFQVTLVPNYMILEKLNLLDKGAALILPGIFGTFGIFFLKQFMEGIEGAFIEEARILGASEVQIITDIIVPLCKPVITSVSVLLFIDYWNMIEQPLVFISSQEKYPLSVYLSTITSQNISIGFACSVLYMVLPMLLMLYVGNDLTDQLKVRSLK